MIGESIAHYTITAKLGEGGMGAVYRASDTKLRREVALKLLPDGLTTDPSWRSRFQREAQLLAALNHPNIATVYGIEDQAIIMELVEGPTLEERLRSGSLPIEEALTIAGQIVDALEAAHEKGIIHRDLKPANIKLDAEERVKVLDFGLAKALDTLESGANSGSSATVVAGTTRVGMILGTASYMSPEQARGLAVDRRTDIWAFGVVLFEMLTSKELFQGETVSDILAEVLRSEIPWQRLPAATPAHVVRLLRRCLERDRKMRLRDIGEARIILSSPSPVETAAPARSERKVWHYGAAALLAASTCLIGWMARPGAPAAEVPTTHRYSISADLPVGESSISISPDGKHISYIGREGMIWIRDLSKETEATALEGTRGAEFHCWSPDSRSIALKVRGDLLHLPASGGATSVIARNASMSLSCAWSGDGALLYVAAASDGVYSVPIRGGETRKLVSADLGRVIEVARLPTGPSTEALLLGRGSGLGQKLLVVDVAKGAATELVEGSYPTYSPSGHILYTAPQQSALWAVPFSLTALKVTGEPFAVNARTKRASAARDGTIVTWTTAGGAVLAWRSSKSEPLGRIGEPTQAILDIVLSPDESKVAYTTEAAEIWVQELDRPIRSKLAMGRYPKWGPTASEITYYSLSNRKMISVRADGSGEPREIGEGLPGDWTPDGEQLVYSSVGAGTSFDLWRMKRNQRGGYEALPFLNSPAFESAPRLSPDAKYVAYRSNESGRDEVYVRPFPTGQGKWQISGNGGLQPKWSRDGTKLYYLESDVLMVVPVSTVNGFHPGTPQRLFLLNASRSSTTTNFDISRNGRVLVAEPVESEAGVKPKIQVVVNWFSEFRDKQVR